MKFKRSDIYRSMLAGHFRTSEIIVYLEGELRQTPYDEDLARLLDRSEGLLYCADGTNSDGKEGGQAATNELNEVSKANSPFPFQIISRRAQSANEGQLNRIAQAIHDGRHPMMNVNSSTLGYLAALIDTYQMQLRR